MKRKKGMAALLCLMIGMTACGQNSLAAQAPRSAGRGEEREEAAKGVTQEVKNMEQTGRTKRIPSEYLAASERQGTVVSIDYASRDYAERGYFIYHAVGTNDAVKSQSIDMAKEMLSRETFTPEHYVFYQKDGGYHDFNAVNEFLYNALPLFFTEEGE